MGIDRAAAHPASLFVHIPTLAHRAGRAVLCRGQSIRRDRCGLAGTCRHAADGVVGCRQRRTTVVAVIRHAPGGTVMGQGEAVAGRRGVSGSVLPRTRLAIRTRGAAADDAAHPARGGGTGGTTVPGRSRSRLQVCPVGDAGDRHAPEDAVEEAFGLAALRWDKIAGCPPEAKRVLLCAVAIRRAIDEHRRPKRVQPAGYPENVPGGVAGRQARRSDTGAGGTLPDGDR